MSVSVRENDEVFRQVLMRASRQAYPGDNQVHVQVRNQVQSLLIDQARHLVRNQIDAQMFDQGHRRVWV